MSTQHKYLKYFAVAGAIALAVSAFRLGYIVTYTKDGRDPAALQRVYDFSTLDGDNLSRAIHKRLLDGMSLVTTDHSMGVELGIFQTKNEAGQSVSACEIYNRIEFYFLASGISVSGEPPTMTVQGDCQPSDYLNKIAPLMIPFARIMDSQVKDKIVAGENDPSLLIKFGNVSDTWPSTWVLKSVRLFNAQGAELILEQSEIKNNFGKHVALELPQ